MKKIVIAAVLGLFVASTSTASTQSPAAPGAITIAGKQLGVPVVGEFKSFAANVKIDPQQPAAGSVTVEVDTTSIDIGLEDFNHELRTKTWFDSRQYPKATFASRTIAAAGNARLQVSGELTIKGTTRAISFPVTVTAEAGNRVFEGTVPIRRTEFNVGEGEWRATDTVADEVQIRFRIVVPAT